MQVNTFIIPEFLKLSQKIDRYNITDDNNKLSKYTTLADKDFVSTQGTCQQNGTKVIVEFQGQPSNPPPTSANITSSFTWKAICLVV